MVKEDVVSVEEVVEVNGVVVVDEDVVISEVELDESVDDDVVGIDVTVLDELTEVGDAKSGENTRANAKMAIRAKAARKTISCLCSTRALAYCHI